MRRASHGTARAREREWLDRVRADDDAADASAPRPPPHVYKGFHDKLAPALRWLRSNAGRPWSKVFAELCAQFDTRTVTGRHIVYDHMLEWVDVGDSSYRHLHPDRYELYVDRRGILRRVAGSELTFRKREALVEAWTQGRFAGLDHGGWWWWTDAPTSEVCAVYSNACKRKHRVVDSYNRHLVFTRERPMSKRDVEKAMRLTPTQRAAIVFAPAPVVRRRR